MKIKCTHIGVLLLLVAGLGCQNRPTSGSESHFLNSCDSQADCMEPFSCICGVCSLTCTSSADCSTIDGALSCQDANALSQATCSERSFVVCTDLAPSPSCGNDSCEGDEDCVACPEDCGQCPLPDAGPGDCPNGTCDDGEDCLSCPDDCGQCAAECTDGVCMPGDIFSDCPAGTDCDCGDGQCLGELELCFCREDCGPTNCP